MNYPTLGSSYIPNFTMASRINNFIQINSKPFIITSDFSYVTIYTMELEKDLSNSTTETLILSSSSIIINDYPDSSYSTYYVNSFGNFIEVESSYDYLKSILKIKLDASYEELSLIRLKLIYKSKFIGTNITSVYNASFKFGYIDKLNV